MYFVGLREKELPEFSRAIIILFLTLLEQTVYATMTFWRVIPHHVTNKSLSSHIAQINSFRALDTLGCIWIAWHRAQSQFSLRLHRIPWELHDFSTFRNISRVFHACLSICLSVTSQCSTNMTARRITQTPHNSRGMLVFLMPKISAQLNQWRRQMQVR